MATPRNGPAGDNANPAVAAYAVTTSDTVDFVNGPCRGIYVGGTGNVVAILAGNAVTFSAVPVGTTLPICATRINLTNTTATLMVALY